MNKSSLLKDHRDLVVGGILAAFLLVSGLFANTSTMHLMMKVVIMALLALSLNVQTGLGGLRPLGHALMFGLGAYMYAISTVKWGLNPYLGIAAALAITCAIAIILGFLLVRRSDDLAFSFLSMGFCTLTYTAFLKLKYVGFDSGISNVPRLPGFESDKACFYLVIVVAIVMTFIIYQLSQSPFSWIFRACRENKKKAECIGVNIVKVQLFGYVLSGMFACVAGILYAMKNYGAYTSYIAVQLSMECLIMCLLGGMDNFWGPVLGAVIVTLFNTQVSNHTIYTNFFLGVLTLFVVMFVSGGILDADMPGRIKSVSSKLTGKREKTK